ncbi:hypothetical protein BCV08_11775 [Vibrio breoganii]|uniref:hypothetical protein n=1 Tax=Vibrio breoganii TaxID=553239 RepID=UPI000C82856E|nr:hypothetical protein [Vibrio breoganii]PMF92604.1 hypothetical protein BCV08_11775 [Vibrio breoganii]
MNTTNYAGLVVHCSSCILDVLETPTQFAESNYDWKHYQDELNQLILMRLQQRNISRQQSLKTAYYMSDAMTTFLQRCILAGYDKKGLATSALDYLQSKYEAQH